MKKKIALLNESRLYLLHLDGAKVWQDQGRLPICDLNMLLSRYIDITTPPTQRLLALMASHAVDEDDKRRLQLLATVKWNHYHLNTIKNRDPSIICYIGFYFIYSLVHPRVVIQRKTIDFFQYE